MLLLFSAMGCGPAAPAGVYEHEEPRFSVRVDASPEALAASVEPGDGYKLALEFPYGLRVGDASRLTPAQVTETRVGFRGEPGPPSGEALDGSVAFGLCRGEVCTRIDHAFRVTVR